MSSVVSGASAETAPVDQMGDSTSSIAVDESKEHAITAEDEEKVALLHRHRKRMLEAKQARQQAREAADSTR